MLSKAIALGEVTTLPSFNSERHYMVKLHNRNVPRHLEKWQPTIDSMLAKVVGEGDIFVTIDQRLVPAGDTHRVGGVHVDGYWMEGLSCNGAGGRWKQPSHPRHLPWAGEEESLFLLSDVSGCVVYEGEWEGTPNEKGGCEHIDLSSLEKKILLPNVIYAGDTGSMLHEGTKFEIDTYRTLVRLNVKGWLPC